MTSISRGEIEELLSLRGEGQAGLHREAAALRDTIVSNRVYFRGLVEISNICMNDCLYCGIRRSNRKIRRFELSAEEIMHCVDTVTAAGINSLVFQSGERRDSAFIAFVSEVVEEVKEKYPGTAITLSLGELSRDQYRRLHDAGAVRYLLRMETSSETHYRQLHPGEMDFHRRLRCLEDLRELGYQVGSGVMINSPGQTLEHMARDILFLRDLDIDMCGMGPYIPHSDSPLADLPYSAEEALSLGLNMIAVLRRVMPDINIASTTALEALSPDGRELGLTAGANVIMPQFSPPERRGDYMLYDNKPTEYKEYRGMVKELGALSRRCGMVPAFNDAGDSLHYRKRIGI